MSYQVTIIGGGPSGLMAAIAAAEQGVTTLLLDKGSKLGTKLAISGGGRCNVTNRLPEDEVIKHIPGNGKFLYSPFSVFNNYDIIEFFEDLGVGLKEEDHGRMFPVSNKAKDVVNALLSRLKELNVEIRTKIPVEAIHYGENEHQIILESKEKVITRSVVLAVGGKAVPHTGSTGDGYAWAKKAGHTITTLFPTEVPLLSKDSFIQNKALQGLSLRDVDVSVISKKNKAIITHRMDMLFTHFGLSGPAILRCSQYVVKEFMKGHRPVTIEIDCLPDEHEQKLYEHLQNQLKEQPRKSFRNVVKGLVPERLLVYLLKINDVNHEDKAANISNQQLHSFVKHIKHFNVTVHDSQPIEKAFVTGGGVSIKEVVPNTLQSKLMERLYFCGEILDIHGYTGGYNITAAMVTGRVAGIHAAYEAMG
ncbi:NAD(P)/FAD-dependent oxidoreductase [Halobacillus shinanisalinarum]|uniref:NAD(P)/FAD-dependent oxidoreductase n=1 Tax=Halobacillus shinanisalinarum TaxID=2932258 RepID=A0ABY4H3L4_9BACI|nr:NAD(P)/FAD-dependent oxidoreductase [Halobacillus shinanisalinarum]UOQ94187.1 NAD(P)/FAD-dependent oxidoreductase [Halobacillus shinanisalinarum]